MYKSEKKWIIAMKGHPFTRKTEFAKYIADGFACPVLSIHDFLDFLSPDDSQTTPQPHDLAFGTMCEIAKSNLSRGCVSYIVIDSPLSSRSHLDRLMEVASSAPQTRLLIVECKSDNVYEWQTRFEEYLEQHPVDADTPQKWYKAKNWEDVVAAIRDGYDERSDDGCKVSKLVLDPLSYPLDTTYHLMHFYTAVQYMIVFSPDLVVYDLWRRGHYPACPSSSVGGVAVEESGSCRAGSGHCITNYAEALGVGYEDNCRACGNQLAVGAAAYTCSQCSLALHRECAELVDHVSVKPSETAPPFDFRRVLEEACEKVYPELTFRCSSSCEGKDNLNPDAGCGDCLFTTHLKSRLMPTVIRHDCHEHFLSVEMSDINQFGVYSNCSGCGFVILESLWYSCKICGVTYHSDCLTEVPAQVEHEHGGHHHHMLIQYSSQEAEDYLCHVCFENEDPEKRDPTCWFYSCQDCIYEAHLTCVADRWDDLASDKGDPTSTGTGEF